MAENEDGQEKKHDATGQKLDEAAEKGNIPKSQDINSLAILGAGGMAMSQKGLSDVPVAQGGLGLEQLASREGTTPEEVPTTPPQYHAHAQHATQRRPAA